MSSSPEAMSSAAGALRRLHFDQLEHARELSILLYTRDRSMHGLAKKLKAVFNRIYISGEIKDSQKIINKFSHDVTEPKQLIDVILVDFDQSGLKMVDFVNRRVHNPDYRNCPVIPVVVLANEVNKPQDILDHVQGCGGAHKVIAYPYSPQEVVFGVMEAAYMLRSVEHTFRDLQRATVAKAKLPYLPVFDAKSAAKINVVDGEIQKVSVATSMSTLDNNNKVEEIDDCGSQCDDVLPDYLQSYRRKPKEKVDPYDFSSHGYGSELRKVTSQPSGTTTRSNVKSSKPPTNKGANQSVTIVEPSMEGGHPNKIEGGASILEAGGDSQLLPGSATEGIFGNSVSFGALLPMDGQSVTSKSTNGVQVDSKSYAETLLGDDSTEQDGTRYLFPDRDIGGGNSIAGGGGGGDGGGEDGGGDREAEEEARDALQRLVLTRQEDTNGLPPLQRLLDKSLRPFWSGALSTMRGVDEHIIAKARKRTDMEHDISNFVNRPRPKTATSLTVSGLNKRQMEGYWKQLRSSYSGQKEHRHSSAEGMTGMMESSRPSSASATRQQSQANSASSTPSHHGGKRPKTASSDHTTSAVSTPASHKATTTTTTTTPGGSVSKVRAKANDLHRRAVLATTTTATTPAQEAKDTAGSSNNHSRTSSPDIVYFTEEEEAAVNDPWAAPGHTTTPSTLRLSRRQRPADIDTLLSSSVDFASAINDAAASLTSNNNASSTNNGNNNNNSNNNANWNTNTMHELMTREYQASMRAERKIAMLAKEVPPDFHVSNLLDVHLTKRRINLGEKGMLEKGLALEKDGDFESASICYSRAGAHSKDPQISRMLLGNLHYRANHLMMALRCYNTAIEIVENRMAGLRVIDDEFLGYHNRAVINFRLGNDAQGLADLQKAVKVNPNHLPARELLSLVKRRMGMYSEAMEDAHVVKVQRLEEERLKREQLEKAKKQRAQKVKYNHEGKVIIHGRQRAGGVVATTAHANHRQENQQQTMLLVQQQQQQMLEARQTRERDREAALRGIEVDVPEPSCLSSLRERIAAHRSSSANDLMSGEDGGAAAGGFLRLFKMTQGMKNELFDEIFIKPTELQVSLLREPHLRSPQDIDIISTSGLGVFPFLRNLHPSILNELSAVVEYRAVSSGGLESVLFKQNQESPGVCFLLTGCVHGTMETGHVSALHGVDVVKLQERSTFGHFDLLFRSPRTSFLKSLEEVLVTVRSNITDRLRPSEHHHDDHGGTNTLSHHGGGGGGGGGGAQVLTLNHHHHAQASNATHSHRTSVDHSTSSGSNLMNATMLMMLNQEGGHTNPSSKHHTIQSSMSPAQQLHLLEQQRVQHEHLQKEKTDFHQLFYHGVDHATGKLTNRGVQPGMFMSYTMSGPCELLMISERDFYRILYDPTVKALQQRIQTLRSCGIFKGWKHEDVLRLARMSQLFTFTRGQTILAQATRPDYLYIIQKGLCKVMKRPNRTEMLMQKLQIAKDKAARIDFKYVFHHGVYNPNDDTWEPLRDLSTPLFAAPTGPTPEELAAAEIAAASAISLPLDHQGSSNNNTNSNGGVLPRVGSAMSVSASLAAAALGGGGGGGGGAVMGAGPAAHSASQIMNLNGGGIGIGGGGGGNNGRPRTAASRVSSVGGDPTPRDLHHSHSHPHLHRASSNMTTVSALTNVSGTSKGGHHHHHHHHGQQHGHQAVGEQHHHLQDVSALMHPHDARPFSPNHAQFHPDTPSHHGQHDGHSVGGGGGARSPGGPSSTSVAGSTNGRASTAPTNGKRRMSNAVSINSLAARRASQAQAHGGLPNGRFKGFRSIEEMRAFPTSDVPPPTALTIHEEERQELAREIARLEALIKVAREQDAIDQRNHESQDKADAMRLKRSESFYSVASNHTNMTGKSGGDLWSTGENSSRDSNVPIEQVLASQLNRKQAEIKLLQWPMIFGESCVLQPEDGVSRGSIVADTTVECIVLHRMQLQTFAVDDNFLDRVRDKAVVYPGDPDIVVDLFRKQNWQQYKSEVMQDISKSRWPKRLDDLEAFVV